MRDPNINVGVLSRVRAMELSAHVSVTLSNLHSHDAALDVSSMVGGELSVETIIECRNYSVTLCQRWDTLV
jgi:hypothetical protein